MALARQFVEQGHHLGAAVAVEGAGGFVGEDDMPAVHQRTCNGHPLLLATGELVRTVAGALGQAQAGEQGIGAGVPFDGTDTGIDRRHLDVFLGRCRRDQVVALKHEAERFAAQPGQFVAAQLGDVFPGEQVIAFARAVEATEDVHQRRLAGARRADDGDKFPGVDRQVDAAQYVDLRAVAAAVGFADVLEFDQWRGQLSPRCRRLGRSTGDRLRRGPPAPARAGGR
ncbi:hypothetical protein [Pseudomonas sp. 24 E 13]|nr:hypothetical protein [Pseudomonas sp. 24 E 13]